jgi:hypothetical protein
MFRLLPPARARRAAVVLSLIATLALAGCGGASGGDGGGGGGQWGDVIAKIQDTFGTTMTAGKYDESTQTLDITLVDGSGKAMAKLFMCSNIKDIVAASGAPADQKIVIRDSKGVLATQADCK